MGTLSQGPARQVSLLPEDHRSFPQDHVAGAGHSGSWPSRPAVLLVFLVTGAFSGYSEDHFALETPAVTSDASVTDAKALSSTGPARSRYHWEFRKCCVLSPRPLQAPVKEVSRSGGWGCSTQNSVMGPWDVSLSCPELAQSALSRAWIPASSQRPGGGEGPRAGALRRWERAGVGLQGQRA